MNAPIDPVVFVLDTAPKARQSHRTDPHDGHRYDPSGVDKDTICALVKASGRCPPEPWDGPIELLIRAFFARPKYHLYRVGDLAGQVKPDAAVWQISQNKDWDNIGKIIGDALQGILWVNDGQICRGGVEKVYGLHPRIILWVSYPVAPPRITP